MNQRYGNNETYRGRPEDDQPYGERGDRYPNQDYRQRAEGNYEGDWGGRGGRPGYAEPRGRQYDPQGWGEGHASMSEGRGGYGDRGDYYLREWAGGNRGGQQRYSSQDFGGREAYPGQRGFGGGDLYDRTRMSGGPHGYGNQGYGNQGYANRNYDNQGYRQDSDHYMGRNQGYAQGRESYGQFQNERQDQGQPYGQDYFVSQASRSGQLQGFRGKGPKGYKRSDDRLQEDISERLMDDDAIDASDVTVQCRDGVVTLEGSVTDRRLKHRIEDIVERCNGVNDIENRITVKRGQQGQDAGDDEDAGGMGRGGSAGNQNQKKKH